MYRITNKSLQSIYDRYHIQDLDEITADDLYLVCEDLGVKGVYIKDKKGMAIEMDRFETISQILDTFTLTVYMGNSYWNEAQRKKIASDKVLNKLDQAPNGDKTFEIMQKMKLGVHNLRPGDSTDVDWNPRYIREVWDHTPWAAKDFGGNIRIELEDLSNGRISNKVTKETIETPIEEQDWEKLSYSALKEACKERGLRYVNVPKLELIKSLAEYSKKSE